MDESAIDITTLPNTSKYVNKHIPIEIIIDLRKRGLSYSQMGKVLGMSKTACLKRLQPLKDKMELADAYKRNKSEVFNLKQSMLLSSVTEAAIKEMQPYQRVVAASILYDKQRLEDGLSTANIDIHSKINAASESIDKLRQLIDNQSDNDD
ncbi:MAG: hypothetical protein Q8O68_00975 [Candidatus Daviesbacteria bacterium]|nr:hypothetical protein [Candidatus Daviesbacteria bacterium]